MTYKELQPIKYSTFNRNQVNTLTEPMFFGANVNVARYDIQRYPFLDELTQKQLSFFWRPEEVDISRDSRDFNNTLTAGEQHIFLSNLKYQTLLDSIQGRSPNVAFLPVVSLPELETWIETWAFSETIHSRSYTHIIRNIAVDPSVIFEDIVLNKEIQKRAVSVTQYYDKFIEKSCRYVLNQSKDLRELKKLLYLTLVSVNVLEAIRFYVSFACSFAFAERKLMEGNAKIIKLIARDEALHLSGTQFMLTTLASGKDDPEMKQIAKECKAETIEIFRQAAEQEKKWTEYLFRHGSMLGLNEKILNTYIEYITDVRLQAIKLKPIFNTSQTNPLPWITSWLTSSHVQVAPQETEISSYLVGAVDNNIDDSDFSGLKL